MREAEDLQSWLASWKQVARGGDNFGEDHEHVLVRGQEQGGHMRQMLGGGDGGPDGEGTVESRTMPLGWSVAALWSHNSTLPLSTLTGAVWSSTPLSPQQLCTKFAKFQYQVETGAQRVEACQQLAKNLLERRYSAAPKAQQRQQELQ